MAGVTGIWVRDLAPDEVAQRRADAAVADALHSPEELQMGLHHDRPEVRWRVVPRLVARGAAHPGTIPALIQVLRSDPDARVRNAVAYGVYLLTDRRLTSALKDASANDSSLDVRESALDALDGLGQLD